MKTYLNVTDRRTDIQTYTVLWHKSVMAATDVTVKLL